MRKYIPRPTTPQLRRLCCGILIALPLTSLMIASSVSGRTPLFVRQTNVPVNPRVVPNGNIPAATVKNWFESGTVTLNGVVKAADSLNFPDTPNLSFWEWSEQMFLWLTSPTTSQYGGSGRIFDSLAFYDVSPPDSNGERTFIPHRAGLVRNLNIRNLQRSARGLPVIFDKKLNRLLEIEPPRLSPAGKRIILDANGRSVEVERLVPEAGGKIRFETAQRKLIPLKQGIAPASLSQRSTLLSVQRFVAGGRPIFVTSGGAIVNVELGQADTSAVLVAQNGSLVYYISIVNDVFAYLRTGAETGGIIPKPTQFPTNAAALAKITAFAATKGKTLKDPNALAVEMKTSWIEAAGLPNLKDYITMRATVPTFDKSDPKKWVPNGQKTILLAMVGMHVVGSTKGHPEMLWATFEHINNTPNANYNYTNVNGVNTMVPQSTAGNWLFCTSNAATQFNGQKAGFSPPNIVGVGTNPIGSDNILRTNPWGSIPVNAALNTQLILVNNIVRNQLKAGDVRRNYIMTGTTWTINGTPPGPTNQVGTNAMSNSTMETYTQPGNCFDCHKTNTVSVSHIYPALKPLP